MAQIKDMEQIQDRFEHLTENDIMDAANDILKKLQDQDLDTLRSTKDRFLPQKALHTYLGSELDTFLSTEDKLLTQYVPSLGLGVLFSHSSRIRCFLDMLYPANRPGESIFQLIKDYENTYGPTGFWKKRKGKLDIDFKFYNCVVFVLIKRGDEYFFCMKHQGSENKGKKKKKKKRIKLSNFRDLLGFQGNHFDTDTYIKVEIKEPENTLQSTYTKEKSPSKKLKKLLEEKDLCIIRHGESTHNAGKGHLYTDTSLTSDGIKDAHKVAKAIALFFYKYNKNLSLYVSELFRTQQTAMIFVNTIYNFVNYEIDESAWHVKSGESSAATAATRNARSTIFNSTPNNPIILIKVPCNHEFSESYLGSGSCYKNQSERVNWFQKWSWKKENVPESRPYFTAKRKYVSYKRTKSSDKSYFYVDDSFYDAKEDCSLGVFKYMKFVPDAKTVHPNNASDYTDMIEAAGYDFKTDQYVRGREDYLGLRDMWARRSWKSSGGSLKKKIKRRTLRRKSKRFTKKRLTKKRLTKKRLTNKRRTTNKIRTNKKRFTKRR